MKNRGFSLIELMVTTAIAAMLSSIAIPSLQDALYKTKMTERALMFEEMERALFEYLQDRPNGGSQGPFGPGLGSGSFMFLPLNPPGPVDSTKRNFNPQAPGWRRLGVKVSGGMYLHYWAFAEVFGGQGVVIIFAESDLNANGLNGTSYRWWEKINGNWYLTEFKDREY